MEKPSDIDPISSTRSSLDSTRNNSQIGQEDVEKGDLEKALSRHEDEDVAVTVEQTTDPNVVNWSGPDDPENALNWPARKKWTNIAFLSIITVLTLESPELRPLRIEC